MTPAPDPREALRKEVAHVLMRAGYGSEAAAFDVADDIILTVQHPGLRWDIDDDHLTPEHRAALAQAAQPSLVAGIERCRHGAPLHACNDPDAQAAPPPVDVDQIADDINAKRDQWTQRTSVDPDRLVQIVMTRYRDRLDAALAQAAPPLDVEAADAVLEVLTSEGWVADPEAASYNLRVAGLVVAAITDFTRAAQAAPPSGLERIGIVSKWGGGEVTVLVDRNLDHYPAPMTVVFARLSEPTETGS